MMAFAAVTPTACVSANRMRCAVLHSSDFGERWYSVQRGFIFTLFELRHHVGIWKPSFIGNLSLSFAMRKCGYPVCYELSRFVFGILFGHVRTCLVDLGSNLLKSLKLVGWGCRLKVQSDRLFNKRLNPFRIIDSDKELTRPTMPMSMPMTPFAKTVVSRKRRLLPKKILK